MTFKTVYYGVLTALAVAGSAILQLLGGWDYALQLLCTVMAADYLTGVACALIWKRSRKAGILVAVLVSCQLDRVTGTQFVRLSTILFFTANDGMSIIENLGIMGLPMPQTIKNAFELLRQKGEPSG